LSEEDKSLHYLPEESGPGLKVPVVILIVAVVLLAGATVYLFTQMNSMKAELASVQDALVREVSTLRESSSATSETQAQRLEEMNQALEEARTQASEAAGQARVEATRRAEELAQQLAAEQTRQREEQERVAQQLSQELSAVSEAADTTASTLGQVQTQVAETRSDVDQIVENLKTVTGDLGVQSGLIATNAQELAALRELGDRDYYDFDITRTNAPVKVGDIAIRLRDTNRDRGRFTLDVVADDKTVRKRARTVNEPLQFYVSTARQPYELVVNEVQRQRIIGYLAVPKVKVPRGSSTTADAGS